MSLKHFHFLFIVVAALFCFGFGAWALMARDLDSGIRGMGIFSLVLGLALTVYGIWFRKKSARVIT